MPPRDTENPATKTRPLTGIARAALYWGSSRRLSRGWPQEAE